MTVDNDTLDNVYSAKDSTATRKAYEGWAAGYDAENLGNGYRVPSIGCGMIARHVGQNGGPIYDAACGTGIIGEMLGVLGYSHIDGSDLSPAMLKLAEPLQSYQRLYEHDLSLKLPEDDNTFSAVTCFGSLGPGHAPPSCLEEFVRVTHPGGHVIFNTRADTYDTQDLKTTVDDLSAAGAWVEVERSKVFRSYYFVEPEVFSQVFVFKVT